MNLFDRITLIIGDGSKKTIDIKSEVSIEMKRAIKERQENRRKYD